MFDIVDCVVIFDLIQNKQNKKKYSDVKFFSCLISGIRHTRINPSRVIKEHNYKYRYSDFSDYYQSHQKRNIIDNKLYLNLNLSHSEGEVAEWPDSPINSKVPSSPYASVNRVLNKLQLK